MLFASDAAATRTQIEIWAAGCTNFLQEAAALWLFPAQAVGAKSGEHPDHPQLPSVLWAMSRINRAWRHLREKSLITSLGLNFPGQNTGGSALQRSISGNPVCMWGSWVWALPDDGQDLELSKHSGRKSPVRWRAQTPGCVHHYRAHPWIPVNSNYTELLSKAAFANPPHPLQWHRFNYLAQSWCDTMTPSLCQQEKHNGKGSLISCASWNLMAALYVTWSKFIYIIPTIHSQVQEHFLCKY